MGGGKLVEKSSPKFVKDATISPVGKQPSDIKRTFPHLQMMIQDLAKVSQSTMIITGPGGNAGNAANHSSSSKVDLTTLTLKPLKDHTGPEKGRMASGVVRRAADKTATDYFSSIKDLMTSE